MRGVKTRPITQEKHRSPCSIQANLDSSDLKLYLIRDRCIYDIAKARKLAAKGDEGVLVALNTLDIILSALRVEGLALDGRKFDRGEALALLLSGREGLNRHHHMKRQRENAKKGADLLIEARESREANWLPTARRLRHQHPDWSDSKLANEVVRAIPRRGLSVLRVSISTIRQSLKKHGLSRRTDK
jgi:hypothetical protein